MKTIFNQQTYFSPGRVNLIGEHLDYNGGLVMPCAINLGITAMVERTDAEAIYLSSATHSNSFSFPIRALPDFNSQNDWANYPIGILKMLQQQGVPIPACSIHFESTLPEGSGLSSSAAIEVLTAFIVYDLAKQSIDRKELAVFCQKMENEFIGVKCGIMDQFAVANGKREQAMMLDCKTLKHEYIPFELDDYKLLILNSKKPRSLIKSAYNERKASCDEALKLLQKTLDIKCLAEAAMEDLVLLKDEVLQKRARHVVSEQLRVKQCAKYLENGDLFTFGKLLNASHESLKNDYEVSGLELDTLAETAQQQKGCLGARMTGAGFGGCAIALVHQNNVAEFSETVCKEYFSTTGMEAEIYTAKIEDGVKRLD